jgi:phage terminase large subunit-like protein
MKQLDLLLEHFDDPDIQFQPADAHRRIKFIETQCRHSEAPHAGKPFILMLFQKAFIEAIYSFKIVDAELEKSVRKYQEIMFLVARKSGKTPLVSAICLAEFFCGGMGTKILCSSNDYEQADLAFQAINAMREQSPALEKMTRKSIKGIFFGNPRKPKKTGKYSYMNKGNIRKISAKTGAKEGRNIAVGMADEVHEMKDDTAIMPIRQSLSTQEEPLFFELTTEGFVQDGYLDLRLKEARQVLEGELERPRWLVWLYTQDNEAEVWQDEKSWVKSNPGLGTIKKRSFLRGMVDEAKTNMQTRGFVLSKDFNIKQNNANAAFSPDVYSNESTFNPEDFRGCYVIGGADLAFTTDLCNARIMIMRAGDPKKYMLTQYFIPEAKLDIKDDGIDYRQWVQQGLITVSPGNDNDFSLITQWFLRTFQKYNFRPYRIGYDNALAKFWVKEMAEIFDDLDQPTMEAVRQTFITLSNPFNLLGAELRSKHIVYQDNPVDRWCLGNVAIATDKYGRIMPCKSNAEKKIDGVATLVNCLAIFQMYKTEYLAYVNQ